MKESGAGAERGQVTDALERRIREALAPDLEVVRVLGHGSVASVYQAKEPALKRLVAVKVLRPEVASDDTARRRFEREAQAAARLNHRNLTDIYRVGRLDGLPFIVMEFINGRNLADAMKAGGPLNVSETKHAILGVASALGQAHANGIIHRDVRPGNILREDGTDRIVLTDFGIAALLETGGETSTQLTTMGHRVGDLRYMSPEQLTGETLTVQADMYSLGVLGYVLLTGEGPFPGGRANEVAQKLHGKARPLRELRPDVDPQLAAVLERCLARSPEHRPRAGDVVRALSGEAAELPARDQSAFGQFLDELRRRKVYTVAVAYLASSALAIGLFDAINQAWEGKLVLLMQIFILLLALGFPVSLSLAWVYDVREGRVKKTPSAEDVEGIDAGGLPVLPLVGLALSVVFAIALGWLLFQNVGD